MVLEIICGHPSKRFFCHGPWEQRVTSKVLFVAQKHFKSTYVFYFWIVQSISLIYPLQSNLTRDSEGFATKQISIRTRQNIT
jgi:hypothetical protein